MFWARTLTSLLVAFRAKHPTLTRARSSYLGLHICLTHEADFSIPAARAGFNPSMQMVLVYLSLSPPLNVGKAKASQSRPKAKAPTPSGVFESLRGLERFASSNHQAEKSTRVNSSPFWIPRGCFRESEHGSVFFFPRLRDGRATLPEREDLALHVWDLEKVYRRCCRASKRAVRGPWVPVWQVGHKWEMAVVVKTVLGSHFGVGEFTTHFSPNSEKTNTYRTCNTHTHTQNQTKHVLAQDDEDESMHVLGGGCFRETNRKTTVHGP